MKIGIFGGSFDPVTKGHTRLANYIAEAGIVDCVYMMPCYNSLYNKRLESGEARLKMIEFASRHKNVFPFDWELKNKIENKGTYEIMELLEADFQNDELYFIIGLDNSQKVRSWRNGDKIIEDLKFIVVPRIGTVINDDWFMRKPHIFLNEYEADEISSSSVKELIKNKLEAKAQLDTSVYEYIKAMNLYGGI